MDNKTLEYMGERVDKARKLQKDIATIDKKIKYLSGNTVNEVRIGLQSGGGIYLNKNIAELNAVLPFAKEAIIKILVEYRDTLQTALDEI